MGNALMDLNGLFAQKWPAHKIISAYKKGNYGLFKDAKIFQWGKKTPTNGARTTRHLHAKEWIWTPYLKIKSKWIIDLNVKLFQENLIAKLHDLRLASDFLDMTPKV